MREAWVSEVSVGLLGPFEVRVGSAPVPIPAGRQRVLLASLALSAGRAVGVDLLAERMWGEALPVDPRRAVQNNVRLLRKALGADAIRTHAGGYLLAADPDQVDALRLLSLAAAASTAPPDRARALAAAAVALWRGEPLTGVDSESLGRDHVPALTEQYLAVVEQAIDLDFATGEHSARIAELRALVARFPLREPLWVRLVVALEHAGRQAEALAAYETVRVALAESLGAEPSAELRAVHHRLLRAERSAPPPGAPRQLPARSPWFTGRTESLAALDDVLGTPGGPRVIALHGPGGVGKTALALEWAHGVKASFPDGQVYLDLRGYGPDRPTDSGVALGIVLRGLGVPADAVPATLDERAAMFRTRLDGRRVLLVLDNARDADQVRPLLPGGSSLALVTSRNDLRGLAVRDGAARHQVRVLDGAESADLLTAVLGRPVDDADLAELARLCGRLPLALVIAAQQAGRHESPAVRATVAALRAAHTRLDVLGDPGDDAADLRAVMSWSYDALDPEVARAFTALGVHPTRDIGVEPAAAVLGLPVPAARRALDRLAAVHLLQLADPDRYCLHDLVAVFAAEKAAGCEQTAGPAADRMFDWYLRGLAGANATAFPGSAVVLDVPAGSARFAGVAEATEWYERHQATLVALVDLASAHGRDREAALIAFLLANFQTAQGHVLEQRTTARRAIEVTDRSGTVADRARARFILGRSWHRAADFDQALQSLEQALELAESTDDDQLTAAILSVIGVIRLNTGDARSAVELQARSVELAAGIDGPRLAHSLVNLAAAESALGRLDDAVEHTAAAAEWYRSHGADYNLCLALGNLADYYLLAGRSPADALALADEALGLMAGTSDGIVRPNALIAKGRALVAIGDPDGARDQWREAQRMLRAADRGRTAEVDGLLAQLA